MRIKPDTVLWLVFAFLAYSISISFLLHIRSLDWRQYALVDFSVIIETIDLSYVLGLVSGLYTTALILLISEYLEKKGIL